MNSLNILGITSIVIVTFLYICVIERKSTHRLIKALEQQLKDADAITNALSADNEDLRQRLNYKNALLEEIRGLADDNA